MAAPNAAMTRKVTVNGAWRSKSGAHWASFSSVALPSSVALGEKESLAGAYAMTGRGRIPLRPLAIRAVPGASSPAEVPENRSQLNRNQRTGANEPEPAK